jgi:dienelactone hydrolase
MVAALVNDAGQFYGSWSELLGHGVGVSLTHVASGAEDKHLAELLRRQKGLHRSLVVPIDIPEAGAAKADPALVYLPAAYFAPGYADVTFPVVELLEGFPSTPRLWTGPLRLQQVLDDEIASNRALPFVAVVPTQNYLPRLHDGECINAVHGPQVETTLTVNVRRVLEHDLRVDRGRTGWAAMGYSTGGFCALNIVTRHPNVYSAAVSLSGNDTPYVDRTTGHLFGHSVAAEHSNNPLWRFRHGLAPPISMLLAAARHDTVPWHEALRLAAAVRPPARASLLLLPRGAHNLPTWRAMEPAAFDWLSQLLAPPLGPSARVDGHSPVPYRGVPTPPLARAGRRYAVKRPRFQ